MKLASVRAGAALLAPILFLTACGHEPAVPTANLSWMLPKTTLVLGVTHTLEKCDDSTGMPKFELKTEIDIVTGAEADTDIGGAYPGGLISVRPEDLDSFWQDRSLAIETAPGSRIVTSLSSKGTNQTGPIIVNVLTTAVKIAGIAAGVPASSTLAQDRRGCGTLLADVKKMKEDVEKTNSEIERLKKEYERTKSAAVEKKLIEAEEKQRKLAVELPKKQKNLVISYKGYVDPGLTDFIPEDDMHKPFKREPQPFNYGRLAELRPTGAELVKKGWMNQAAADHYEQSKRDDLTARFTLEFPNAYPECGDNCDRAMVPTGTLFREVRYIPILVKVGTNEAYRSAKLPFGQYGIPRSMPMSASIFESYEWGIAFNVYGEVTKANYGNKASGVGASSLAAGVAGTASSIAKQERDGARAVDIDTLKRQSENDAMKAQIDNLKLTDELKKLRDEKGLN